MSAYVFPGTKALIALARAGLLDTLFEKNKGATIMINRGVLDEVNADYTAGKLLAKWILKNASSTRIMLAHDVHAANPIASMKTRIGRRSRRSNDV